MFLPVTATADVPIGVVWLLTKVTKTLQPVGTTRIVCDTRTLLSVIQRLQMVTTTKPISGVITVAITVQDTRSFGVTIPTNEVTVGPWRIQLPVSLGSIL